MEKRPERKETGEWAVHLRPFRKHAYWRKTRHKIKQELKDYGKDTQNQ